MAAGTLFDWATIDIGLRFGASTMFVALALVLWRDAGRHLVGRSGAALSLCAVCYLILSTPGVATPGRPWMLPLLVGSISMPVAFWIFAGAWFEDEFVLRRKHLLGWLALVATGLVHVLWLNGSRPADAELSHIVFNLLNAGFVGDGLWTAWRGRDADLVESRRRIRTRLVAMVGVYMAMVIVVQLLLGSDAAAQPLSAVNALGVQILALGIALSVLGTRQNALLQAPTAPPEVEDVDPLLLAKLDAAMQHDRAYRQDGLTIGALAGRLALPEYRLRKIINGRLGHRNFNAYLNGFRVDEAKTALADPEQRNVPILTIALDAGFGSLAAFNRAFRLDTGATPTEYRQKSLGG